MTKPQLRWRTVAGAVGVTMLVQMMCSIGIMSLAFLSPLVTEDLDVPTSLIGFQVAWSFLWAVLAAPASGNVVRRYGAARASQAALVGSGVACVVCASGSLPLLVVGSALAGAAYSLINPASSQILDLVAPIRVRNLVFATKQSAVPIGWAVAGLGLPAAAAAFGWRVTILLLGVAMVVATLGVEGAHRNWRDERDPTSSIVRWRGYFQLGFTGDRVLLAVALAGLCYAFTQVIGLTFLVSSLAEEAGWSVVAAGSAVTVMQAAGALGRLAMAGIADLSRSGLWTALAVGAGTALAMVFTGVALRSLDTPLLLLAVAMLGFLSMSWNSLLMSEAARLSPPGRVGVFTARLMIYYSAGSLLGPLAYTLAYGATGSYSITYMLSAIPALAGAAFLAYAIFARPLVRAADDESGGEGRPRAA